MQTIQLLSNASTSSSGLHTVDDGGLYEWSLEGTFNGGSYQFQASGPNGTLADVPGATLSAAGALLLWITPGTKVKVVETGTTSAMYSQLRGPINK